MAFIQVSAIILGVDLDLLRKITKWFNSHLFLSFGSLLMIILIIFFFRNFLARSDGELSTAILKGTVVDAVYGIGTVTAQRSYSIKPGVTSTLNNLYVREGDIIATGGKLAKIDQVIYRAPFDGIVSYIPFKVGENIFSQLPVLVLTDITNRYLVVSLEQQGALRVRRGQKAKLSFDSIRTQTFEGIIESVYSYNSNFLARINVTSLPAEILPDMTADVAIIIKELPNALLVPVAALENDTVLVKRKHHLPFPVHLKLGLVDGKMAEVISGDLQTGDQVLLRKRVGL